MRKIIKNIFYTIIGFVRLIFIKLFIYFRNIFNIASIIICVLFVLGILITWILSYGNQSFSISTLGLNVSIAIGIFIDFIILFSSISTIIIVADPIDSISINLPDSFKESPEKYFDEQIEKFQCRNKSEIHKLELEIKHLKRLKAICEHKIFIYKDWGERLNYSIRVAEKKILNEMDRIAKIDKQND